MKLEKLLIDVIVLSLKLGEETKRTEIIEKILDSIKGITNIELSIRIVKTLLQEFKSGRINELAKESLEVLLEMKRIEEREKSKKSVS